MCTRNREYIWQPRHFNRLFRKEKKNVFFPKKLASHAGVFRGARFSKNACVGGYQKVVLEYIWEPRHFNRLFRQEKSFVSFDRGAFGRPISITLRPLILTTTKITQNKCTHRFHHLDCGCHGHVKVNVHVTMTLKCGQINF